MIKILQRQYIRIVLIATCGKKRKWRWAINFCKNIHVRSCFMWLSIYFVIISMWVLDTSGYYCIRVWFWTCILCSMLCLFICGWCSVFDFVSLILRNILITIIMIIWFSNDYTIDWFWISIFGQVFSFYRFCFFLLVGFSCLRFGKLLCSLWVYCRMWLFFCLWLYYLNLNDILKTIIKVVMTFGF